MSHYPLATPLAMSEDRCRSGAPLLLYSFAVEAARADSPEQCFTIAAVQRERDAQFFSVITAELEPVRSPPLIAFFHSHSAGMSPLRCWYRGFTLE